MHGSARLSSGLVTFALLLACAAPTLAHAEEAAALLQQAEELFTTARFKESLALLNQAAQRTVQPALLGRIQLYRGLNFAVLGQPAEADRAFALALESNPTLQLEPGRFNAEIVERFERAREKQRASSKLQSAPPVRPKAPPLAQASPPPRREGPARSPAPRPTRGKARRVAGWIVLGTGAASLATSAVLGVFVHRRVSDYNAAKNNAAYSYGNLEAIADEGHRFETGHLIALGVGAGLAATGGALLIWDLVDGRHAGPQLAPFVSAGQAGLSWSQRF